MMNVMSKALGTIYFTFIKPIHEYDAVIWNCSQYEKDDLEKTQNQASGIDIGVTKLLSINALYNEIQWETLHQRRQNYQLTLFL